MGRPFLVLFFLFFLFSPPFFSFNLLKEPHRKKCVHLTWYPFKDRGDMFVKRLSGTWRNGHKGGLPRKFCT